MRKERALDRLVGSNEKAPMDLPDYLRGLSGLANRRFQQRLEHRLNLDGVKEIPESQPDTEKAHA